MYGLLLFGASNAMWSSHEFSVHAPTWQDQGNGTYCKCSRNNSRICFGHYCTYSVLYISSTKTPLAAVPTKAAIEIWKPYSYTIYICIYIYAYIYIWIININSCYFLNQHNLLFPSTYTFSCRQISSGSSQTMRVI